MPSNVTSFITYRPTAHLDRKHTIFGRVVGGMETLSRLENAPTDDADRPIDEIAINDVVVFVDPFDEFQKDRRAKDEAEREKEEIRLRGGTDDDRTTWTGKRAVGRAGASIGGGARGAAGGKIGEGQRSPSGMDGEAVTVGKYLKGTATGGDDNDDEEDEVVEEVTEAWDQPPPAKKFKASAAGGGGFGNFDNW